MVRGAAAAVLGAILLAGCASDLERLPATPGESPAEAAPPEEARPPVPEAVRGEGLLDGALHGERILEGVVILDPLPGEGGAARFTVRNEGEADLPDLILAVVFAVPTGDAAVPLRPRIVTIEAPLSRGEERAFAVAPPPGLSAPPARFRVLAGPPELLAAAAPGSQGTAFLGGLLECVALETALTDESPSVTVGLRERIPPGGGSALPPLEAQLLLARAGRLLWSGPWIRLPGPDAADGVRSVLWRLPPGESLAGGSPYLRVREKR